MRGIIESHMIGKLEHMEDKWHHSHMEVTTHGQETPRVREIS
jgi:hypothetical protein